MTPVNILSQHSSTFHNAKYYKFSTKTILASPWSIWRQLSFPNQLTTLSYRTNPLPNEHYMRKEYLPADIVVVVEYSIKLCDCNQIRIRSVPDHAQESSVRCPSHRLVGPLRRPQRLLLAILAPQPSSLCLCPPSLRSGEADVYSQCLKY